MFLKHGKVFINEVYKNTVYMYIHNMLVGVTLFLPWTGEWLRVPMQLAIRHHKRHILHGWRLAAVESMASFQDPIRSIQYMILKSSFQNWKYSKLCVSTFIR